VVKIITPLWTDCKHLHGHVPQNVLEGKQFVPDFQLDCPDHSEFLTSYVSSCTASCGWQHLDCRCNLLGFSQLDDEGFIRRSMQKWQSSPRRQDLGGELASGSG
jgi:hypothetical protein